MERRVRAQLEKEIDELTQMNNGELKQSGKDIDSSKQIREYEEKIISLEDLVRPIYTFNPSKFSQFTFSSQNCSKNGWKKAHLDRLKLAHLLFQSMSFEMTNL